MTNKKLPQFLPEKSPRTVISPLELAAEIEKDMAYQARIGLEAGITLNAEKCLVAIEALRCARPEAAHKWIRAYASLTKSLDLSDLADYDDELASEVKKLSKEAQEILDAPFLCAPSPLARSQEKT